MKIGVFGGAFNPVHNGHVALAKHYVDYLSLDKLIIIPTAAPPHKTADGLISGEDRINMLALAFDTFSNVEISDVEFHREGKSYTYDTLVELKNSYTSDDLYLIIGADQYFYFEKWYRVDDILDLATVVTAAREDNQYRDMLKFKNSNRNLSDTIVANFSVVDISSSEIREWVKKGDDISQYVPAPVDRYIKEHKLYV